MSTLKIQEQPPSPERTVYPLTAGDLPFSFDYDLDTTQNILSTMSCLDLALDDHSSLSSEQLLPNEEDLSKSPPFENYFNEVFQSDFDIVPYPTLYVGNICSQSVVTDLITAFQTFGKIESVKILSHLSSAFVKYNFLRDAIQAKLHMDGKVFRGFPIKVNYFRNTKILSEPSRSITHTMQRSNSFSSHTTQKVQSIDFFPPKSALPQIESVNSLPSKSLTQNPFTSDFIPSKIIQPNPIAQPNPLVSNSMFTPKVNIPSLSTRGLSFERPLFSAVPTTQVRYFESIPIFPEGHKKSFDQNKLRDFRKKLDDHPSMQEISLMFNDMESKCAELATDYIGNVILQKIIEKGDDNIKIRMTQALAPHFATISIHKNGTYVAQKLIDSANTAFQYEMIIQAITPFTPSLMLDQFGNYVIQCCLRILQFNQFIFEAIHNKCPEIAQGRYGARAIRTCLESTHTTKIQKKLIGSAIVESAYELCINQNGNILMNWFFDSSSLPGRFRILAPRLAPHVVSLSTDKLGSNFILKIIHQRIEPEARDIIIHHIFFNDHHTLQDLLKDTLAFGILTIQKIISSNVFNSQEKTKLADRIRLGLSNQSPSKSHLYKKLVDELSYIPSHLSNYEEDSIDSTLDHPSFVSTSTAVSLQDSQPLYHLKKSPQMTLNTEIGNDSLGPITSYPPLKQTDSFLSHLSAPLSHSYQAGRFWDT